MINKCTYQFLIFITLLISSCSKKDNIPSLKETYSKTDTKPFGANIAYRQLEAMFKENIIRDKHQSFSNTWEGISDTGSVYICITAKLFLNEEEVNAMMDFIYSGNTLVIAAGLIDENLLKRINCNEVYTDNVIEKMMLMMGKTNTSVSIQPDINYSYFYYPFQNHFININSKNTKVLGYNDDNRPNSIVFFYGKGKLFLQCDPRALSNYFILKDNNYQYLQQLLAYVPAAPEHVYWDDYYSKLSNRKNGKTNSESFSTFSEILKYPPLKFAFWFSILLMLLYILFGGKRKQRIIEDTTPNINNTVAFTETIGRLYLQKKDNKNIADKMITYFNDHIRNTYFLNANLPMGDFVASLSRKSGVEIDSVETLIKTMDTIQKSNTINDDELLNLHEQILTFYKNKS